MNRRTPRSTRTDTLFPDTTRFRSRLDIVAKARLVVKPRADRVAPQRLHLGTLYAAAERAFAFALQPELVEVAPDPSLCIPQEHVLAVAEPRLEAFEHDGCERKVVHDSKLVARRCHGVGTVDRVGGMPRPFQCARWRLGRWWRGRRAALIHVRHRAGPVRRSVHRRPGCRGGQSAHRTSVGEGKSVSVWGAPGWTRLLET